MKWAVHAWGHRADLTPLQTLLKLFTYRRCRPRVVSEVINHRNPENSRICDAGSRDSVDRGPRQVDNLIRVRTVCSGHNDHFGGVQLGTYSRHGLSNLPYSAKPFCSCFVDTIGEDTRRRVYVRTAALRTCITNLVDWILGSSAICLGHGRRGVIARYRS